MRKSFLSLLFASCVALAVTGCTSGGGDNKDLVPELQPTELYQYAQSYMSTGDYGGAIQYLEAIDSRYPFGSLTDQVQLDLIYCYYKSRQPEKTSAAISRYLRLNPTSQFTDYVLYMRGLNEVQLHADMIQDFLHLDRSQKDPAHYYEAMKCFRELIERYPNSGYVKDAHQRILYIRDQLAQRELAIARYYMNRGAYLSSIRHCQSILYSFRETEHLQEALEMMVEGYEKLGLPLPAQNTQAVLTQSFGG